MYNDGHKSYDWSVSDHRGVLRQQWHGLGQLRFRFWCLLHVLVSTLMLLIKNVRLTNIFICLQNLHLRRHYLQREDFLFS